MAFSWDDVTNFYDENKDSELGKFVISQAQTVAQNQIANFTKSGSNSKASSTITPTPIVMQSAGSAPMMGGMSNKTIYMIVGGAVALVAIIVLIRK